MLPLPSSRACLRLSQREILGLEALLSFDPDMELEKDGVVLWI